jgi:hypothetical protein
MFKAAGGAAKYAYTPERGGTMAVLYLIIPIVVLIAIGVLTPGYRDRFFHGPLDPGLTALTAKNRDV